MSDWKTEALASLGSIVGGGTPSTGVTDYWGGDVPWLTPKDMSSLSGRFAVGGERSISRLGLASSAAKLVPAGSVVLSSRAPIGLVAIAARELTTNQGCRTFIPGPSLDSQFVYYQFKTMSEEFEARASGSTFKEISGGALGQVPFRFPPRRDQEEIAEVLSALDDKIAANTSLARKLYTLVELEFDRSTKQATRVAELADLVATQYGVTTSGAAKRDDVGLLRVTDINKEPWIDWANVPGCEVSDADRAKYLLHESDIVVARMADPGKCGWIAAGDPDTVFASYLVRLRVHDADHSPYIFQFLRSSTYQRYADAVGQGSVQRNMNAKAMVAIQIALPSAEVLGEFARRFRNAWATMSLALRENRTLAATRDALLPHLMSGKLRVRDAERIAAEAGT